MVGAQVPSEPYLKYRLSSELKASSCPNMQEDGDGDCLNDNLEADLAWVVAPAFFFDEDEECGSSAGDYGLHPYYQVRPLAPSTAPVDTWANNNKEKRVEITYFLNWVVDCGGPLEGDHLGDSESIIVTLRSYDLVEWEVVGTLQYAHGRSYVKAGFWLDDMADAVGLGYITVAVEDDKHGSWGGKAAGSQSCGDDVILGFADCFPGMSWEDAVIAEEFFYVPLTADQNIGEPPDVLDGRNFLSPAAVLINDHGTVRFETSSQFSASAFHLNNLSGTEYWWRPPSDSTGFCGWTCPDYDRESDGTCSDITIGLPGGEYFIDGDCASGLESKLSRYETYFSQASSSASLSIPPSLSSCAGIGCGTRDVPQTCYCDELCHYRSDCCSDKETVCGAYLPYSCSGKCGRRWADPLVSSPCSCSWGCDVRGDCCADASAECSETLTADQPKGTCFERCGFSGVDSEGNHDCACDHLCAGRGDCCVDKDEFCAYSIEVGVGSCNASCMPGPPQSLPPYAGGGSTPPAYGGFCFCDPACVERGDCCDDVGAQCGVQVNPEWTPDHVKYSVSISTTFCASHYKTCREISEFLGSPTPLDNLHFLWAQE